MERPLRPVRQPAVGERWLPLAVVLAVPLLVLAASIRLLASERFLRWEYGRDGFPKAAGLSDAQRLALAVPATAFIVGGSSPEALAALRLADQPVFMPGEIAHLEDVRRRVRLMEALGGLSLALLSATAVLAVVGRWPLWPRWIERGGWLTLALATLTGLAVGLAWPAFFLRFHELLFPPGTWQFPADSALIRLFPERFWFDVALAVLGLALGGGVLAVGVGRAVRRLAIGRRQPGER